MADIELVIKIPEELWEKVKDGYVPLGISKYLKNGTPLEQIRDEIEREADYQDANVNADVAKGMYMALEMIDKYREERGI